MEKHKTAEHLNNKRWYKTLKVLDIIFIVFCYLVVLVMYIIIFTDGTDGINIFLKIASIPVLIFFAWIVSGTPQQAFYYLMNIEESEGYYSKIRLIAGVFVSALICIFIAVIIFRLATIKPSPQPTLHRPARRNSCKRFPSLQTLPLNKVAG